MKKTLAIFSINQNSYSETFIQAHRKLPFDIKFYYGGNLPTALESDYNIYKLSMPERIRRKLLKGFSIEEKRILFSLRKEKVDCVLAEYGPTACESLKVIEHLRIPLVVHFHGYDTGVKSELIKYETQYKNVFNYAKEIIAVSNKMKDDLIKLGCPPEKITIAHYGPNAVFFATQPTYRTKQLLAIGRFVDKKAPYLTILAFKKITNKFPGAKLIMVGDGPLLNACKNLSAALDLQNSIEFKGVLNQDEIKVLFENSVAFVQHSIVAEDGDIEGTPVSIIEAQAAALPVISTRHAGIPDIVIENITGFLVDEHDVDGMANHMFTILNENGLACKMGVAARKRIKENFSMEKNLLLLESVIRNACN